MIVLPPFLFFNTLSFSPFTASDPVFTHVSFMLLCINALNHAQHELRLTAEIRLTDAILWLPIVHTQHHSEYKQFSWCNNNNSPTCLLNKPIRCNTAGLSSESVDLDQDQLHQRHSSAHHKFILSVFTQTERSCCEVEKMMWEDRERIFESLEINAKPNGFKLLDTLQNQKSPWSPDRGDVVWFLLLEAASHVYLSCSTF